MIETTKRVNVLIRFCDIFPLVIKTFSTVEKQFLNRFQINRANVSFDIINAFCDLYSTI